MAFGQQSGPPATARQVQELLSLLQDAGHSDFRDARGPMGFNQRQAGGRFTRDEASAFIDQLQESEPAAAAPEPQAPAAPKATRRRVPDEAAFLRRVARETETVAVPGLLGGVAAEDLAAELRSRGWTVTGP